MKFGKASDAETTLFICCPGSRLDNVQPSLVNWLMAPCHYLFSMPDLFSKAESSADRECRNATRRVYLSANDNLCSSLYLSTQPDPE